jgi:ABC-2 type transport system permease protein
MIRWLLNVALLSGKELRSLLRDVVLMVLIAFVFTIGVYSTAKGIKAEVSNASVAILDGDHSDLSRRLRHAIRPPYFKTPVDIARADIAAALDRGKYIFIIEIPPRFETDVLAGRSPAVQLLVDATAMTQAGLGTADLQEIFNKEVLDWLDIRGIESSMPALADLRLQYNPNAESAWHTSVMQIVANITLMAVVLVGAAVIREREHGTIEHLLVMPVRASEIAAAKILTNGLIILVVALLSLWLVVHRYLGVPIAGSVPLFALGTLIYLFSATSAGVYLATLAPSMPQFGLFAVTVYAITYLLSGAATSVASMPLWLQSVVQFLPTTQYVSFSQEILYRAAGLDAVWPQIALMCISGALFLALALARFRSMLARQT